MEPLDTTGYGVSPRARMGVPTLSALLVGTSLALAAPDRLPHVWIVGAAACAFAICGFLTRGRAGWAMLWCAAAALACSLAAWRTGHYPSDSVGRGLSSSLSVLDVEGVVLDEPSTARPARGELAMLVRDTPATRFTLRVRAVHRRLRGEDAAPASGDLWVRVEGEATRVRAGDAVRVRGQAFGVEAPMNPGERDFRPRAHERNIAGRLLAPSPALVTPAERIEGGALSRWARLREALRARSSDWIDSVNVGDGARAMLHAGLLGETEGAYSSVQRSFARTGLAHVLAVSGLHLALLAWFARSATRGLLPWRRAEPIVVALAVCAYLALAPANPPIVRAGVMTLGFLAADALGRRYDPLNVLAWTACIVVLARPTDATSVGFQLSFLAVGGLIVLAPRVRDAILRLLPGAHEPSPDRRTRAQRVAHRAASALGTAVAAWAITAPLVAFHAGMATPWAALASVVFAPLFSLLLCAGYATMLVSAVAPTLGAPLAWATGVLAEWMLLAVHAAERAPLGSIHLPAIGWWWAALATVAIALLLRGGAGRRRAAVALLVIVGSASIEARRRTRLPESIALRIDTLAVGDGACHLLRAGRDAILWDCGSTWVGIGERDIPDAVRSLGAWRVRTLVVSHPNLDHYSGVLDAAPRLGLREVVTTRAFLDEADADPLGPVASTVRALRARGVSVRAIGAGDALALGEHALSFLWPAPDFASDRANDASLVARVEVPTEAGVRTLLMLGDIEPSGMDAMTRAVGALRADVAEAPHHGSARPGAIEFVRALRPSVVLQSTGPQRLGDERWDAVKADTTWWTTASDGAAYAAILRDGRIVSGPSRRRSARE